jgi:hypothetical protein
MLYSTSDGGGGGVTVMLVCGVVAACDDPGGHGEGLPDVLTGEPSAGFGMFGTFCAIRGFFDGVEVSVK